MLIMFRVKEKKLLKTFRSFSTPDTDFIVWTMPALFSIAGLLKRDLTIKDFADQLYQSFFKFRCII